MTQNRYYILLDAARMGSEIETAKKLNQDFASLFLGKSEESLEMVAPYLFTFNLKSEFASWFFSFGWGNSWGIIFTSAEDINPLIYHFQQLLFIKTRDNGNYYFRFYDPRVLRKILPSYGGKQLSEFFGAITRFICEDETPGRGLVFSLFDNVLRTEILSSEQHLDIFKNLIID